MLRTSAQREGEQLHLGALHRFVHKAAAAGVRPDNIAGADQTRLAIGP